MKAPILTTLSLTVICCGVSVGAAADLPTFEQLPPPCCDDPIVIYRHAFCNESLPELGARLYDKVDYELKLRQLARDIRVAKAELELQRERMRVYEEYFGYPDAGLLTLQNAKLDIVRSEEQLKLLHQAKLLALRYRNDQVRYRKLLLAEHAALIQLTD